MLALVTGATGFIGSHLCRALLDLGWQVRIFRRTTSSLELIDDLEVEHAIGDVTQPETLTPAMQNVDLVCHAASKVDYWRGPDEMYPITVGGTRNVLRAALEARVQRLVYTSSVGSLGVPDRPGLLDETHVWNFEPRWWSYGHAKHLAEREVQWAVGRGLDAVVVNPSIVLGPGDLNRISGEIIIQIARGIVIASIPGGMNAIHVDDVARGHLAALERGQTGERYILGAENLSFPELFRITAEIVGVNSPQHSLPNWILRPLASPLDILCRFTPMPFNGDLLRFAGRNMFYNTQKARRELGFQAEKSVRQALRETYEWYRAQGVI